MIWYLFASLIWIAGSAYYSQRRKLFRAEAVVVAMLALLGCSFAFFAWTTVPVSIHDNKPDTGMRIMATVFGVVLWLLPLAYIEQRAAFIAHLDDIVKGRVR